MGKKDAGVLTAKTRVMRAYRTPEHPATVTAAGVFNDRPTCATNVPAYSVYKLFADVDAAPRDEHDDVLK